MVRQIENLEDNIRKQKRKSSSTSTSSSSSSSLAQVVTGVKSQKRRENVAESHVDPQRQGKSMTRRVLIN